MIASLFTNNPLIIPHQYAADLSSLSEVVPETPIPILYAINAFLIIFVIFLGFLALQILFSHVDDKEI
ncbi:MAG: hypothetical protein AB8G95_19355 [Anaerolineae bacterium]